jgi:hypothetical protein
VHYLAGWRGSFRIFSGQHILAPRYISVSLNHKFFFFWNPRPINDLVESKALARKNNIMREAEAQTLGSF